MTQATIPKEVHLFTPTSRAHVHFTVLWLPPLLPAGRGGLKEPLRRALKERLDSTLSQKHWLWLSFTHDNELQQLDNKQTTRDRDDITAESQDKDRSNQ